jgi:hypothetical protein
LSPSIPAPDVFTQETTLKHETSLEDAPLDNFNEIFSLRPSESSASQRLILFKKLPARKIIGVMCPKEKSNAGTQRIRWDAERDRIIIIYLIDF